VGQASRPTPRYKTYVRLYRMQLQWTVPQHKAPRPTLRYNVCVRLYRKQLLGSVSLHTHPDTKHRYDHKGRTQCHCTQTQIQHMYGCTGSSCWGQYLYPRPSSHTKGTIYMYGCTQKTAAVDSITTLAPRPTLK
jgi:hypothetical protein